MISNCGHDENGKFHSGKAGDQTKTEWEIRAWFNKPWTHVLWHPDEKVRLMMAADAEKAARNDNIGYDQWQRTTFWTELKNANYKVEDIKNKCESDCSSGVAALAKAAGYKLGYDKLKNIPETTYTGNMIRNFKDAGFVVSTDPMYLTSDKYLEPGYILFIHDDKLGKHHAAINLSMGANVTKNQNEAKKSIDDIANEVIAGKWGNGSERKKRLESNGYNYSEVQAVVNSKISTSAPKYTTYEVVGISSWLNVRNAPNTNNDAVGKLYNGDKVKVVSISNGWAKLDNGNYISAKYIKKV
ncbi:MAG: SH3 domain-containing protein [Prevotellaceae bacterium]|nr:SH3 domain-containing protein [Candidatus Faecinaster equi]